MGVTEVTLTGRLICRDAAESARVAAHLPEHTRLTRAEPGCLTFEVQRTDDPLVWQVDERFADAAAFEAHRARAGASAWGQQTQGIRRDYIIDGRR